MIPRKDMAWPNVSRVPHPYIAVNIMRHQCGRLQKLDIHCNISRAMNTCRSLKSVKCSPSQSRLILRCKERNAHCVGKICFDAGRTGYSWFNGLLRNPWSGVPTPQVLGYSGMRVALNPRLGVQTPMRWSNPPRLGVGVPHVQSGYTLA